MSRERKKVHGVGTVGHGQYKVKVEGKVTAQYSAWDSMLRRCYSIKSKMDRPTYNECTVCEEWHDYQIFATWFTNAWNHSYHNLQIDKDLLFPGNKQYSPDTCVLIPKSLNLFTLGRDSLRGDFPIGTCFNKKLGRFVAYCSHEGRTMHLWCFDDPLSAHYAWYKRKVQLAYGFKDICDDIHPNLFAGVLAKIDSMRVKNSKTN